MELHVLCWRQMSANKHAMNCMRTNDTVNESTGQFFET
jgi:hypothetical protein